MSQSSSLRISGSAMHAAGVLALVLSSFLALAQTPSLTARSIFKPAAVEYLYPEQVTLPAGKATKLALHFRIAPGLHINSHAPSEDELIPTTFSIPEDSGASLEGAVYPPGEEFTLPIDPSTKLSVYTGEFTIQASIKATTGDHLVEAKLRYQACDNNACMPPKTITVAIDVVGK
ncbi:MAG: protein-disulfide reductase DsbD N-terminal domain-containing protein [Terracidiphilus sp.]|jgi:DsbC/DsbD-like thiol-disulfide interchange protein